MAKPKRSLNTGVNITTEGRRHLGAALGCSAFVESFVSAQVDEWVKEVIRLSNIATTQPHGAYAGIRHSLVGKWTFLARTIDGIAPLFQPLEEAIRQQFIPALLGREVPGDVERELLAMPTRLGGLGLVCPETLPDHEFQASTRVTAPLAALIAVQTSKRGGAVAQQKII